MMFKLFRSKIYGVSLVSLLIGITLGAFLIVVMLQIFNATRATYKLSENLAEMNQVLRYATMVVNDVVGQAGYRTPNSSTGSLPDYSSVFTSFSGTLTGPTGSTYVTTETNSDDPAGVVLSYFPGENVILTANGSDYEDKLWVKFEGDPSGRIRGCNDLYGLNSSALRSRLYSRSVTSTDDSTTGYYCEDQYNGVNYSYPNGTVTGTELIPPELFVQAWVRYGEDLTGNGFIDRWSLGPNVANRNQVYAVRFAFLIRSRDAVRTEAQTQSFSVFGQTVSYTDMYIYKLQMFTVLLPNAPSYPLASIVATP